MKKYFVATILLAGALAANAAEGIITFDNIDSGDYNGQPYNVNAPVFMPDGTTKVSGSSYRVALYSGTTSTADSALTLVATSVKPFGISGNAGSWSPSQETVTADTSGGNSKVQVRAWRLADGATWEEAKANPNGMWGQSESIVIDTVPTGGTDFGAPMIGLKSFNLQQNVVPEPTTISLGLLGAGALLMRRRKKANA